MFGSKLRSWMENHIVRPRKKGNKNKNANSNVAAITKDAACSSSHDISTYKKTNAAGFTIYHTNSATTTTAATTTLPSTSITSSQANYSVVAGSSHNGCSSVIASPARRREVSPIQNHSRYGWQSPDQETVTSPKSDNFLYAPEHHRVRRSHHHQHPLHHTAPNSKDNSREDKANKIVKHTHHQPDCSSSSISSLSWSTGSKEPSMNSSSNNNTSNNNHNNQVASKMVLSSLEIHCNSAPTGSVFAAHNENSTAEIYSFDEEELRDPNAVHYEEIRTILRRPDNFIEHERPKSEQLTTFVSSPAAYQHIDRTQDDASTRYGKLLPSKMHAGDTGGSFDNLNANYLRCGSAECIQSNNNFYDGGSSIDCDSRFAGTSSYNLGTHYQNNAGIISSHTQRSRLRTGRYVSPTMNGNQQGIMGCRAAGPIHSLSSPESAYSTGYSTDGTSPGAIYTPPEYYINIRTGTHYFPKSVNSLAIEAQRYKFGLNKIEEMSPIDPLPKTSFANAAAAHKRPPTDSYEAASILYSELNGQFDGQSQVLTQHMNTNASRSPLALSNTIVLPTLKGFESPTARQRPRIRTNPWYSTTDTSSSGTTIGTATTTALQHTLPFMPPTLAASTISLSKSTTCCSSAIKMELDAASTSSSGIKSHNDEAECSSDKHKGSLKNDYMMQHTQSSDSSSSLTEVENMQRTYTPNTIRRKRTELMHRAATKLAEPVAVDSRSYGNVEWQDFLVSDEDATLNEMMGKFDESYVYEKETDILSSSDSAPTDCGSDLDTGQDAGDECDTDELLDIDFIDTSSIQEVLDKRDTQNNFGSCHYYSSNSNGSPKCLPRQASIRSRKNSRNQKMLQQEIAVNAAATANHGGSGSSQRRRKRFMKTRKKSTESRDHFTSPMRKSRESRSVGGTPVCLRRNHYFTDRIGINKASPLTNRSSSLVFTDLRESRHFMAIAESEKALLKADLEADVKYKQLILEAESIIVSMKSSAQSITHETPVSSPRRINPLANKRVEMLKNCEIDVKREHIKQQQRSLDADQIHAEQELAAAINKRIDLLKYETASAPNSPKSSRFSPRKTHLTNFINQNAPPEVPLRKSVLADAIKSPKSPQLQLNGRRLSSPNSSPLQRRRFRSQSPRLITSSGITKMHGGTNTIDTDSETDNSLRRKTQANCNKQLQRSRNIESSAEDVTNHNYIPEAERMFKLNETDYNNCNTTTIHDAATVGIVGNQKMLQHKLMSFSSVGSKQNQYYCPQSEPLKRKVYKGSSTFERIKKSIDLESEKPKQLILDKSHRKREIQNSQTKISSTKSSMHDLHGSEAAPQCQNEDSNKKQLILNTISDLKRSLECQSVELNGFN